MALTQLRGDTQIQNNTLTNDSLSSRTDDLTLLSVSNGNIVLSPNGTGTTDASSKKITNLADPTSAQDAATKFYVDSIAAGLDPKESVRVATLLNVPGYVTGTITIPNNNSTYFPNAGAAAVIDGLTLASGNRVLIKDQTDPKQNGIYTVTNAGVEGTTDAVLLRSTDMDGTPSNEVSGGNFTFVESGSQSGSGWVVVFDGNITLDTDNIDWTQFSDAGSVTYLAGNGMTQSGSGTVTFNVVSADTSLTVNANDLLVNLNTTGGLETSTGLRIKTDTTTANTIGVTHTANGAGTLYDANSFTGTTTLALASGVAGDGLALTAGVLSVNVDNSSIEINADTLRVKASGVTYAMSNVVTRETPSGTVNGSNTDFTLAFTPASGSEEVYLNGLLQDVGGANDYTIVADTITFNSAPLTGSKIRVSYWKA